MLTISRNGTGTGTIWWCQLKGNGNYVGDLLRSKDPTAQYLISKRNLLYTPLFVILSPFIESITIKMTQKILEHISHILKIYLVVFAISEDILVLQIISFHSYFYSFVYFRNDRNILFMPKVWRASAMWHCPVCREAHWTHTHHSLTPPPYLMQPKKGLQRAQALCRGYRGRAPYWDIIFMRNLITDFVAYKFEEFLSKL